MTNRGASAQHAHRGPTRVDDTNNTRSAVDSRRKALQICLHEPRRNAALLPITAILEQPYGRLHETGYGRLDSSSLMKLRTEK